MEKLKWKHEISHLGVFEWWFSRFYTIKKQKSGEFMLYVGKVHNNTFKKLSSAKKVAQLIHNG